MDCHLLATALKRSRQRLEVVAAAVSRAEIIQHLAQGNVDVVLVDADLQDGPLAGLEALPEIHAAYQNTPVIALFDTWNDDWIVHAFRAGAMGVFCRSEKKLDMLWKCITAVHAGQVWANSVQKRLLLKALRRANPIRAVSPVGKNSLTAREIEVATLVAEGMATGDIAKRLAITEHTVNNYLFRIYNKLGISNRIQLILYLSK
jgi:DNA-binding NarL/FixJ family response regulator